MTALTTLLAHLSGAAPAEGGLKPEAGPALHGDPFAALLEATGPAAAPEGDVLAASALLGPHLTPSLFQTPARGGAQGLPGTPLSGAAPNAPGQTPTAQGLTLEGFVQTPGAAQSTPESGTGTSATKVLETTPNAASGDGEAEAQGRGTAEPALPGSRPGAAETAPPRLPVVLTALANAAQGQSLIYVQEQAGGEPGTVAGGDAGSPSVQVRAAAANPAPVQSNAPQVPLNTLAAHIAQQAQNGVKRFDIRIDPPELGRLEIRLDVTREGQVTTHLVVERSETLDFLQRDARNLERALQNAGLDLSKDGLSFSLKDQGAAAGGGDGTEADEARSNPGGEDTDAALDPSAPPHPYRHTMSVGLDIRI